MTTATQETAIEEQDMDTEQRRARGFSREVQCGVRALDAIPIEVVPSEQGRQASGILLSVVNEIAAMLEALMASGKTDSIDLRRAPVSPQDRARLREMLGQGELEARLNCLGPTHIHETAVSGVWWVTHYSDDGRVLGEFIEVTTCPEMFTTSPQELHAGLDRLHARLSAETCAADPEDIARKLRALGLTSGDSANRGPNTDPQVKRGNGNVE